MSGQKTYPTHRIHFGEKTTDQYGKEKIGKPVEVATVWPRKDGKQGGIIQWNISPEKLGDGVYFQLENERQKTQEAEREPSSARQAPDRFDRVDTGREQNREHQQGQAR